MRFVAASVVLAALLTSADGRAAPAPGDALSPPELTEQAIDAADLGGWRARLDAKAQADAARKAADAEADERSKRRRPPPPDAPQAGRVGDEPPDPFLIRMQILLDRAHASPGVIDGRDGENTKKAVRAFETMHGLAADGQIDPDFWNALSADRGKSARVYEVTPEDVNGRYVPSLPSDYAKLAKLKWLGYRDPVEMLAERFHLDEALLRRLNPGADFGSAGQKILVAETGAAPQGKVAKIIIDKEAGELRAYGEDGTLILVDPATVGSDDTPSPTGRMKVNGSFPNPFYRYDPKKNFQQGKNTRKLTLRPGPNGPVGSMWIDLSKPTYGIHGTPEPSQIDKTSSHGCVRLTNWDAEALAGIVEPRRTSVEFK